MRNVGYRVQDAHLFEVEQRIRAAVGPMTFGSTLLSLWANASNTMMWGQITVREAIREGVR